MYLLIVFDIKKISVVEFRHRWRQGRRPGDGLASTTGSETIQPGGSDPLAASGFGQNATLRTPLNHCLLSLTLC
jgi:hypothetical protein